MSDDRDIEGPTDKTEESSTRPPPLNPFEEPKPLEEGESLPPLIDNRRTAAISGVIVGLIALVLVVGLCVTASYAFG